MVSGGRPSGTDPRACPRRSSASLDLCCSQLLDLQGGQGSASCSSMPLAYLAWGTRHLGHELSREVRNAWEEASDRLIKGRPSSAFLVNIILINPIQSHLSLTDQNQPKNLQNEVHRYHHRRHRDPGFRWRGRRCPPPLLCREPTPSIPLNQQQHPLYHNLGTRCVYTR